MRDGMGVRLISVLTGLPYRKPNHRKIPRLLGVDVGCNWEIERDRQGGIGKGYHLA